MMNCLFNKQCSHLLLQCQPFVVVTTSTKNVLDDKPQRALKKPLKPFQRRDRITWEGPRARPEGNVTPVSRDWIAPDDFAAFYVVHRGVKNGVYSSFTLKLTVWWKLRALWTSRNAYTFCTRLAPAHKPTRIKWGSGDEREGCWLVKPACAASIALSAQGWTG